MCDDADACTLDTCSGEGECSYEPVDCADGSVCTSDECDVEVGCTFASVFGSCEEEPNKYCHPLLGCKSLLHECPVSDDPCITWTYGEGGCVQILTPCDDGNFCSLDFCVPGEGCTTIQKVDPCNDGDATTLDTCNIVFGCQHSLLGEPWCLLSGSIGDEITCPFDIVRTDPGAVDWAASFEATLYWRTDELELVGFEDWIEFEGIPPFAVDVPPAPLYPSGHTVLVGANVEQSNSQGTVLVGVVHFTSPDAFIANAKLLGGEIVGNPTFLDARFRLKADFDEANPSVIRVNDYEGGAPDASDLYLEHHDGLFVIPAACQTDEECDDNNLCTTDSCGSLHYCGHKPLFLPDFDPCTVDTCEPEVGPIHTPRVCVDGNPCTQGVCISGECNFLPIDPEDGDACTADFCSPEVGVFHLSANCFDGTLCTVDYCQPGLGCVNEPNCEDDVPCTLDYCAGFKCAHDPDHGFCDDADPLTDDYCAPELPEADDAGCVFAVP